MKKAGSTDKKKNDQQKQSQSQLNSQEQAIEIQNLQQETSKQFLKKLEQRLKRVYEVDQTNKNDFISISQIKEQVHETLHPIITECKMIYSTISSQESKNIEFEDQIYKIQLELTKNMRLYDDVARILKMIQMLESTDNKINEKLRGLKEKQKTDHKELFDKFKLQDLTNSTDQSTMEEQKKRLILLQEEFDKFLKAQGKIEIEYDMKMIFKFEQMQLQLDSFKLQNEQRDKNHKEITSSIKNQLDGNIKTILKGHQKEMENMLKLEISVKQIIEMKKKIIIMEPQIKEIQIKQQSLMDLPNFVEKVLPFYSMIQISEALKKVLVINPDSKNYESLQFKIQNYEVSKIQQILEYNEESKGMEIDIKGFNKKLLAMAKGFGKEKCGITHFVMGKDYNIQMNTYTPEFEKLSYEHLSDLKKLKQQQINNKSQQQILQNIMETFDQLHHLIQIQEINQLKEKANANKMLMKAQKPQQKVEISQEEQALIKNLNEQIKLLDKQWLKVFQDQVMQKKFEWNEYEPLIYKYCKMDDLEKLKTLLIQEQRNLAIKNQRQNTQKTSPERQKKDKSPKNDNIASKADDFVEQEQDQRTTRTNKQQVINKKGKEPAQVAEQKGMEKQQLKQTKQFQSATVNKLDSFDKTQTIPNPKENNPQQSNQQQNSQQQKTQVQINSYQNNQQQNQQIEKKEQTEADYQTKQESGQPSKIQIKIQDQQQQQQDQNQYSSQTRQQETQIIQNIETQKQQKTEQIEKQIQQKQQNIEENTDEQSSQSKEKGNIFDQISTQNLWHIPTQQDEINRFTPSINAGPLNKNILSKNNISESVSRKTIQNQIFKKNSSIRSKSKNQSLKSKILSSKSNQFKIQNDSRQKITDIDQGDDQEDADKNYGEEESYEDHFNDGIIIFKSFFKNNVRQLLRKNNMVNRNLQNQIKEIYKKINRILNMMPQNYENKQQPKTQSGKGGSITVNVEPGVKEHITQIVRQIDADVQLEYEKTMFKTNNIQNYQNLMSIENILKTGDLNSLNRQQKDQIIKHFYEKDSQIFFPHNLKNDAEKYIKALQSNNPQKSLNEDFIKESNKELLNDKFTNEGKQYRLSQAFMKLIRIKQLGEQRPAMETGMSEFSDQQIQQIQQMIDQSIDWVKTCMTTSFSLHIEDLNASFQNLHSDFEANSQLNNSRIKATEGKIIDCLCSVNFIEEKYKVDHQFFKQFKQRIHSDLKYQIQQIKFVSDQSAMEVKMSNQQSLNIKKIVEILIESNMIESIIQDQELIDKQKLFLLGIKNNSDLIGQNHNFINLENYDQQQISQKNKLVSMNISEVHVNEEIQKNSPKINLLIKKNEIENTHIQNKNDFLGMNLPTTHPNHFVQMLKKACLAYSCSPVQYGNQLLPQKELRQKKKNLLYEAQNLHNQQTHQIARINQPQSQQNDKDEDMMLKQDNTIERDDQSPTSALQIHKINQNTDQKANEKMDSVYQVKIQNKLDQVFSFLNDDAQYNIKNTNLSSISNIHLQPQLQNKNDHKNQTNFIIKKDTKPKNTKQNINQQSKVEKDIKFQSETKAFDSLRNSTNFKSVNQGKKQSVPGIFGAIEFMPHGSQTNSTFDVWVDKSINLQKQIEGFNKKEMQIQILKEKKIKEGIEQFNQERKMNQSQNLWKRRSVGSNFDNSQDQNIYKSYDSGAGIKAASQQSTMQGLDIRAIFPKDSTLPLSKDFSKQRRLSQDFINNQQQNNIHHIPLINTKRKQTDIDNVQNPTLDHQQQNLQNYQFQNLKIQSTVIDDYRDKRKANQFQNINQMRDYLERPNTSAMAHSCIGLNMIKQNSKSLSKKSNVNNHIISDNNSDSGSNQKLIKLNNIDKRIIGLTENNSQGGLAGLISGIQIKTQSPHIKSSKNNQDSKNTSKMKIEENTNDLQNQRSKIQSQQYNVSKKIRYSMDYSTIQDDQNNQKYFQGVNNKLEQNSMIVSKIGSQRQIDNQSALNQKESGIKNNSIKFQNNNQDTRNIKKIVGATTMNNPGNLFDIKDSFVTRQLHPIPFNSFSVSQNES